MSGKTLVAFATMYGSTREVAEEVAASLEATGAQVEVKPARDVKNLGDYDSVVLGAPLIMHRLHGDARKFLARNQKALQQCTVAVFALGPVTDDEKEWQECRAQLAEEMGKLDWLAPVAVEMFGGRFDPALLKFPFNKFAGAAGASDARDWDVIRAWSGGLPERFGASGTSN